MIPLILGTVLAVIALAFVLHPIFFPPVPRAASLAIAPATTKPGDTAVAALREIEFDRATGKLSDADYAQLKARYTREALTAMRRADAAPAAADEIEAAVLAWRARHPECPEHGARPEPDAVYCSDCGRFLPGACTHCGAPVDESGSRFCSSCGHQLAA